MKLNQYELEAERQYRVHERIGIMFPDHVGKPTKEQLAAVMVFVEPEMEALRNFEYEE